MRSSLSSTIVAAAGSIILLGCGRSAPAQQDDAAPATGGTLVEMDGAAGAISPPATGGAPASGGIGAAGIQGSGGTSGGGGESGTGGRLGTGGALGTGGMQVAGGATGTGGSLIGVGGILLTGGASSAGGAIVGHGGISGAGGQTGPGGSLAAGGSTGGAAGSAGASGSGGATASGGLVGAGGSAVTPPFPPKFFGNIDTGNEVRSDFVKYWDNFTPENIGKWAWVQSTSANVFSWERLDAEYKYCEDNHIAFKEHSFIWGVSQAAWINDSNAIVAVQTWMKSFCDRYPKTRLIDVVDEPLHSSPKYATGLRGGGTGWDWVSNSFKFAHEACPNAILILSEYNIVEYSSEHSRIIDLVKTIQAAGAPVMAIGAQGHDVAKVSLSTVQTYVADIVSQTGLPVYFTQLDLPVADDNQQAAALKDLVTAFWNDPSVPGITYWGYIVGRTWRSNTGLMNNDGTMRPAMTWLMDFLGR